MPLKKDNPCILAIETSCDDTAIAILKDNKILANVVSSQTIHEIHGGVIPELAGRAHLQFIVPVFQKALQNANITTQEIDAIAFTQGPGLVGSLLVGCQFAKGLSMGLNIPLIGINHLKAHIAAHYLSDKTPKFPFLNLLVSGGHTQIILVKNYLDYEIIGTTIDDAAGEAFDKAAKMLGLPYPGGPLIDKLAEKGNPNAFVFPIAKLDDFQYSFSGLKTSILYFLQKNNSLDVRFIENNLNDIAASIRYTIVKTLINTFEKAILKYQVKDIGLAGGVSANQLLRKEFQYLANNHQINAHIPAFEFCTDNAAMIASLAKYHYLNSDFLDLKSVPFSG
ncbi:MAG: tRNA (adenosine(37)-N6)-threonylcarbamoyltransferase complex transferase subunit TsaD [Bacteroidota bacterium]|nr:tRNA (adenosine(37)-N6)-threonylcarbamoyltransferase complex transferase subunit TsaD [Bacteroidota bacterium]